MLQSLLNTVGKIRKRDTGMNCSIELVRSLSFAERKGRLFAAGDIHGEFHVLMSALHAIAFDYDNDLLLLAGDIHDRGVNSVQCMELLREPWLLSTLGNHELMLLNVVTESGGIDSSKKSAIDSWIVNGGEWCLDQSDAVRASWRRLILENVPLYWMLERRDGNRVMMCHAEPSSKYLADVLSLNSRKLDIGNLLDEQTLWGRNLLYNAVRGDLSKDIKKRLLPALEGVLFSMHGHSYVKTAAWVNNQLFLDTGTTLGKKLTLVDIDHAIPGMCNGIHAWSIAEEKLLECESIRLWPD